MNQRKIVFGMVLSLFAAGSLAWTEESNSFRAVMERAGGVFLGSQTFDNANVREKYRISTIRLNHFNPGNGTLFILVREGKKEFVEGLLTIVSPDRMSGEGKNIWVYTVDEYMALLEEGDHGEVMLAKYRRSFESELSVHDIYMWGSGI